MMDNKNLKQARAAFVSLCNVLDADEWHYEKDADEMEIDCTAQGDDLPIPIRIRVDGERLLVSLYSRLPFTVSEDRRREMAVAVSRANYNMVDGSFDYDISNGYILFRITGSIRKSLIGENALRYLVYCACNTVDNYNDKFLMVAKSAMTCDEVAQFID